MHIRSRAFLAAIALAGFCTISIRAQTNSLPYIDNFPIDRALTMKDVREQSPLERSLIRNAIYARHGRPFANPTIAKFFAARKWYHKNPNWKAGDEDRLLSPIEKQNAKFVASTEGSATESSHFFLDNNTTITAGQSVGHVKLGMNRTTVLGLLGQPQQIQSRPDKLIQDNWISEDLLPHMALSTMTVVYRHDKVAQIEVSSIRYATANQVSVKNTLAHIRGIIKPLKRTAYAFPVADGGIVIYDNIKRGLAFTFYVDIDDEHADSEPFSIIVHPANEKIIPIAREAFGHGFKLSHPVG